MALSLRRRTRSATLPNVARRFQLRNSNDPAPEQSLGAIHWTGMPRKLKVYQTSQGFFDLAIAAPSMKAALEAWDAASNLFHQGFAKEAEDGTVIAAAMAKPGVVLQRPVGSSSAFREHAKLPSAASLDEEPRKKKEKPGRKLPPKTRDEKTERKAAARYEREERERKARRAKEEAQAAKAREKRNQAIEKAQAALLEAEAEHEERAEAIAKDLEAVQRRAEAEDERWRELRKRLEGNLRKTKG